MTSGYDALIFDNDGVLTTPTRREALRRAIRDAFERVGVTAPRENHVDTLFSPTVDSLRSVAKAHDVAPERLWEAREREAIEVQLAELENGNKRLYDDVESVASLQVPRAIVSNNQHETIENIVDHFGLSGFDPWLGREPSIDGIRRKKPRPYYLERVLADLQVERPLYVGDSRVDVAAATACEIDSAFVRRDHRIDYELPTEPTYEVDSLAELEQLTEGARQ